jgi:protein-disulfide isomerase
VKSCGPDQDFVLDNSFAPRLGDESAPIEVAVFGDLQCPYTQNLMLALNSFVDRLIDDGKFEYLTAVFRHFLRSNSPGYRTAAISIAAAHRQGNGAIWGQAGGPGMIWCYIGAQKVDEQQIIACAEDVGLDMERFALDRADPSVADVVDRDIAEARRIGFEGVPGVVLCGKKASSDPNDLIDNLEYLIYQ